MSPFIVAELSANHNGLLDRAIETIDAAANAGADAVKFQTFIPELMALPGYVIESGQWAGRELLDLYREAITPAEWHDKLFSHARSRGLIPFSSPFDVGSIDFLESLKCPIYKIASFEIIDLPLIAKAAQTRKQLIISTGMAEIHEIRAAVSTARGNGCSNITLLHCTSEYPAKPEQMNLATMNSLWRFNCNVGLSDHSLGTAVSIAAVALGATVIEKHFTLSRSDGGLDSSFSMEPDEFRDMVDGCRIVEKSIGKVKFGQGDKSLRRSLYYAEDLDKGTVITKDHLKTLRPALGASPLMINRVIGRELTESVKENEPVHA